MDFASPAAPQGWGSGGPFASTPSDAHSVDLPDAGRRQAEWERQIETLDQKEIELHQTQLRLIREQTAQFIRDLNALRHEVSSLKSNAQHVHVELSNSVEARLHDLQDDIDRDRRERDAVHGLLHSRVVSLEQGVPIHKEQMEALRSHIRTVESAFQPQLRELQLTFQKETQERLSYVERMLGDSADKISEDVVGAHAKADQLHSRLSQFEEKYGVHMGELKKTYGELSSNKASQEAHHANLRERVDYVESVLNDSADKHNKALEAAHGRLEQLHTRLANCERHGPVLDDLKKTHSTFWNDKSALDSAHSTLKERVDFLEGSFGDSADRHAKDIETMRTSTSKMCSEHKAHGGKLAEQFMQEKEARDVSHASVQERMRYLEEALGDSAEKHDRAAKAFDSHKQAQAKLSADMKAREAGHATLQERLGSVEHFIGDSADKHSQEIAAAHVMLDTANSRIAQEHAAREAHSAAVENLRKAHGVLSGEKQALEKSHATLAERLDFLEKALGDSADKQEIESVKTAHQKIVVEAKARDATQTTAVDRITQLQREKQDLHARHSSLGERVDYIEKLIGENADKHMQEIENIRSSHGKKLAEVENIGKINIKHANLEERMEYLEHALGDSSDKHAQAIANAHAQIEVVHSKFVEERSARESHSSQIREHLGGEVKARESHSASIEERLKFIEKTIGENADHQMKLHEEHKEHKENHGKVMLEVKARDERHATLADRLKFLEEAVGDSADKHMKELSEAKQKMEQLHGKLGDEKAAREAQHGTVRELVNKEQEARDNHHASLAKRIDTLEDLVGGNADKHLVELEAHKGAHGKLLSELKAKDAHQVTVQERLSFLEKALGDSAEKHSKELAEAHSKLDQVHQRLGSVEKHGDSIKDLKKAQSDVSSQKTHLEAQHSSLRERVDYLESSLGDSADRHSKALNEVRSAHSKLANDAKSQQAGHTGLAERLSFVEKVIGDSAEKHAQELAAAHAKIDSMHGRVSTVEAQGTHIDALKKAHTSGVNEKAMRDVHTANVGERLDYVEKVLGDSVDRHNQELSVAHQKLDALQNRLGDERQARDSHYARENDVLVREKHAREVHHASVEDRLGYLEAYLGESADKHARDIQVQSGSLAARLGQLEQRIGDELAEIREHINGEKVIRAQHSDAIADHLEGERRARDGHESSTATNLKSQKKAMETHEKLVQEQFAHEKSGRDRHLEHVQAMLARERESRDKLHETHLEHLQRESSSREGQNKDIHDILVKERSMREQHHATYQEFLHSERSARMQMEELLAQERHERGRHHETVGERVDSLQRTVSIFDSLIRKEMEERAKEHRRIWDAIDNHTHDLSTQVLDVANKNDDEEGSRPEMRTVLPPSRVIRPSSAGSPVTYSWSMPQTHPDPATIVSSVTRQFPGEPMTTGSMARVQSPLRELRTLPGPVTMGVAFWDSQAPARIGQAPSAYGHSLSRCGTNGSVSPQYSSGNSPMPGQKGADRPNASVERVMCGHSHYGGERSHKAEVHTGFVHHLG